MELRFELDENNQRQNYSTEELFGIQEQIRKFLKKRFPVGRRKRNEKRQQVGTLKSLSLDRVDKVIGRMTGESHENVRRRRKIVTAVKSNPNEYGHILESVDKGGLKLKYAAEMIEREEQKKKPPPPLPDGEFDVILIDPPWEYDRMLEGAPRYKLMSSEKLKKLKIPAAKRCVMFMWATNPKLPEALELMEHFGFKYKTNMVWVKGEKEKNQKIMGYYVRGSHELLLIGTKGTRNTPAEKDRPSSAVYDPSSGKHSQKSRKFARIIETMYPKRKKIEMFAREKDPDDDGLWTYYGDELDENSKN